MATLESLNFPILTPGQMNPFHEALSSGLDTYQNMVKSAYMPQQLQAEIASKAAYATYSPYSYLSKALSDPMTLAILAQNPDQLKMVMGKFATMPTNPYASLGQGSGQSQPTMWDKLKNSLGLGSSSQTTPDNAYSYDAQGNNVTATPQEVSDIANNGNGSSTKPAPFSPQNLSRQAYIKAFPNSPEALQVQADNELWKKNAENNATAVDATQKAIQTNAALKNLYPDIPWWQKGAALGRTPAIDSKAQLFDKYATTLSTANTRALQSGHITNKDFQIGEKILPGRVLNEESFNKLNDYNQALNLRARQKIRFDAEAQRRGMTYQDANDAWSNFIEKYPLFDEKTDKLIKENTKVSPFDSPEKSATSNPLPETSSGMWPSNKEPINANDPKIMGHTPPPGTVWMVRPDGMQVTVHTANVKLAKDKYKYRGIND